MHSEMFCERVQEPPETECSKYLFKCSKMAEYS